ncbi:type II secretion system protein [Glaciecola siphonariae]|uniref:Type II secretion system protein n=1 Tax=Glaciecola siphonariae TaxID=521012 RepID=A0ABV9LZJ1_9ALTE
MPSNTGLNVKGAKGFTLVELILVIIVLGIVSVGVAGFVRSAMFAYIDMTERESLLREGSFFVERFTRELADSVPNSVRITGDANTHCLQFVPLNWNTYYLNIPKVGDTPAVVDLVEMHNDLQGLTYVPDNNDVAIVFPLTPDHVYGVSNPANADDVRVRSILSCSDDDSDCATNADSDGVVQLTVNDGFFTDSPARRLYIADSSVSYCVRGGAVYRHESAISATQPLFTSGGSLMAQHLSNVLSPSPALVAGAQDPFRLLDSALRRNAYTQARFIFTRDDEQISFIKEVHIPNVP